MGDKDDESKPWKHSITTSEIRHQSRHWSLSNDASLLHHLQEFSQKLTQKTHDMDKFLDNLVNDVKVTGILVSNVINDFHMLSNAQFIENRVYDEKEQDLPEIKPPEKTKEELEKELVPRIQQALDFSIKMLENNFDTHHQGPDSDSESEDKESPQLKGETILEPKSTFLSHPMPYIIGSVKFNQDDYMGISSLLLTDEEDFEEEEEDQETKPIQPMEMNHRPYPSTESESEAEEMPVIDSYSKSSESLVEENDKRKAVKENDDLFKPVAYVEEEPDQFSPFTHREGLFSPKEENASKDLFSNAKPTFASREPPKFEEVESTAGRGLFDSDGEEDLFGPPSSQKTNIVREGTGEKPLGSLAAEIGASLLLQKKRTGAELGSGASTPSVGHKPGGSSSQSSNSLFTEEQEEQVEIPRPKKNTLFDDDDEEEADLFTRIPTAPTSRKNTTLSFTSDALPPEPQPQQAAVPPSSVAKPKAQVKRPSLFDDNDDEDDDIFNVSKKPLSTKESSSPAAKKVAGGVQLFGGLNPFDAKKMLTSPRKESVNSDAKESPVNKTLEKPRETKSGLFESKDLDAKNSAASPLLELGGKQMEKKSSLFDSGEFDTNAPPLFKSAEKSSLFESDDFDLGAKSPLSIVKPVEKKSSVFSDSIGSPPPIAKSTERPKEKASSLFDSSDFDTSVKVASIPPPEKKEKNQSSLFDSGDFNVGAPSPIAKPTERPRDKPSSLFDSGDFDSGIKAASIPPPDKKQSSLFDSGDFNAGAPSLMAKPTERPKGKPSSLFDSDGFDITADVPPLIKRPEKPKKSSEKVNKSSLFDDSDDFEDSLFSATPQPKKMTKEGASLLPKDIPKSDSSAANTDRTSTFDVSAKKSQKAALPEVDIFADTPISTPKPKKSLDFSVDDEEDDLFFKADKSKTAKSNLFSVITDEKKEGPDLFLANSSSVQSQGSKEKPEDLFSGSLPSSQDSLLSPSKAITKSKVQTNAAKATDDASTSQDSSEDTTDPISSKKEDIKKQLEKVLFQPKPKDPASPLTESPTSKGSLTPSPTNQSKSSEPLAREEEKKDNASSMMGFDKPADTRCQLETVSKGRVHGQKSRRPPTRRGRQAALLPTSPSTEEEDLFSPLTPPQEDFPDSKTFQSTPIHDPSASLFISPSPSEQNIPNQSEQASESSSFESQQKAISFSKQSDATIPTRDSKETDIFSSSASQPLPSKDVFQDAEDHFATPPPKPMSIPNVAKPETTKIQSSLAFLNNDDDDEEDIFTPKSTPSKPSASTLEQTKISTSLFGPDNDIDLFSTKHLDLNAIQPKEAPPPFEDDAPTKKPPKKSAKEVRNVFDDDDDDDIFTKLPARSKKSISNKFLFDDQLGDIFSSVPSSTLGSASQTTPGTTQERRKSSSASSAQKTLSTVAVSDDPLRLLDDS